jgi:hypothetical protein
MNDFQLNYEARLKNWYDLRDRLRDVDIKEKCVEIDKFWQQCPLSTHYLHPIDIEVWPDPWELIYDNNYCVYARSLGMVYTLLLLGVTEIELIEAKDDNYEDVVLVLVKGTYILNYWPNTVLTNNLGDFKIIKTIDINPILEKISRI